MNWMGFLLSAGACILTARVFYQAGVRHGENDGYWKGHAAGKKQVLDFAERHILSTPPLVAPNDVRVDSYTVKCRCGWQGRVGMLLREIDDSYSCPQCEALFLPVAPGEQIARVEGVQNIRRDPSDMLGDRV